MFYDMVPMTLPNGDGVDFTDSTLGGPEAFSMSAMISKQFPPSWKTASESAEKENSVSIPSNASLQEAWYDKTALNLNLAVMTSCLAIASFVSWMESKMLSYCSRHVSSDPFSDFEMSCLLSNSPIIATVFLVWSSVASTSTSSALKLSRTPVRKCGWIVLAQRVGFVVFWQKSVSWDRRLCFTTWMLRDEGMELVVPRKRSDIVKRIMVSVRVIR